MIQLDVHTSKRTEFVPITDRVQQAVKQSGVESGVCHLYVPHTTAAVTINENADPMVPHDILSVVDRLIPFEDSGYRHMEGNSDAHIKSSLTGPSLDILIHDGVLVLGTWQGIMFAEYDGPRNRKVYIQIQGEK